MTAACCALLRSITPVASESMPPSGALVWSRWAIRSSSTDQDWHERRAGPEGVGGADLFGRDPAMPTSWRSRARRRCRTEAATISP